METDKCLGKLPAKAGPKALMYRSFATLTTTVPEKTNYWVKRKPFTPQTWGNDQEGCCTIAKQANMFRRFERLELKNQTIVIPTQEVHRVYRDLTSRLYGSGDTGAYETDALDCSRREATALRSDKGRPLILDAYLRVDPKDLQAVRNAMYTAGGHGLAVCLALPMAYQEIEPPNDWTTPPEGTAFVNEWEPYSWGGHSMWAVDYDKFGVWLEHTWGIPLQRITWAAFSAYCDECHIVIDSVDKWRRTRTSIDIPAVVDAVNDVSSQKIGYLS
jgi:hypothetical protein